MPEASQHGKRVYITGNRFHWRVETKNGEIIKQDDLLGNKFGYDDLDKSDVRAFELWDWKHGERVFRMEFTDNQQLIWRRRTEQDAGGIIEVCHIIGKREKVKGKSYSGIVGVFESDGRMEVAERFEEDHPWFFPAVPVKGE